MRLRKVEVSSWPTRMIGQRFSIYAARTPGKWERAEKPFQGVAVSRWPPGVRRRQSRRYSRSLWHPAPQEPPVSVGVKVMGSCHWP
jgi:hypothetical protein